MKKLKLNPDHLRVASFEPVADVGTKRGTVRGMEPWSEEPSCLGTCAHSCNGTCFDPSCGGTCGNTCDAILCFPIDHGTTW